MCIICELKNTINENFTTPFKFGVEMEIVVKKNNRNNYLVPYKRICLRTGEKYYPDHTPVSEFVTGCTDSFDLLLGSMKHVIDTAYNDVQWDDLTNYQKITRAGNHIHISFKDQSTIDNITIYKKFGYELVKLQPFFMFTTSGVPTITYTSWRNNPMHRYNSITGFKAIKYLIERGVRDSTNVSCSRDGTHIEFRLPDAMIHPIVTLANVVLVSAVGLSVKKHKKLTTYSRTLKECSENCEKTIIKKDTTLIFSNHKKVQINKREYIKKVMATYDNEINELLNTIHTTQLKDKIEKMMNLYRTGHTITEFIPPVTIKYEHLKADEKKIVRFFRNQTWHYLNPIDSFDEMVELLEIEDILNTNPFKEDKPEKFTTKIDYRSLLDGMIHTYIRSVVTYRGINVSKLNNAIYEMKNELIEKIMELKETTRRRAVKITNEIIRKMLTEGVHLSLGNNRYCHINKNRIEIFDI